MELSNQVKLEILQAKLENYKQQLYSLKIDMQVAKYLEDEKLQERIVQGTTRIMKSIEVINKELDALQPTEPSEVQ